MTAYLPFEVLIVEDNTEFGAMLQVFFKRIGIRADLADTGEQAFAYIDQYKPDLILLDLELPTINGWQVLDYTRKKYGEHGVPVIVSSAHGDRMNRIIGRIQYVSEFLIKPFTPQELFGVVDEVLELYKVDV